MARRYTSLMYGGEMPAQEGERFHASIPAASFFSTQFTDKFFKTDVCQRWDKTSCAKKDSMYYQATHHGIDSMVRRCMRDYLGLVADTPKDVVYTSKRYNALLQIGSRDLYEGLQDAAQIFSDYCVSRYDSILSLHTVSTTLESRGLTRARNGASGVVVSARLKGALG